MTEKVFSSWDDLDFWQSGEWQVIEERLDDYDQKVLSYSSQNFQLYNPKRELLFNALDTTPFDQVKVLFMGQDPYPNPDFCTGLAFSIPYDCKKTPVTLANILGEYCTDLKKSYPKTGDLTPWANKGVLLWNATPTCEIWKPNSHKDWTEWGYLTEEIIKKLNQRAIVAVLMGYKARLYSHLIDGDRCKLIELSHPSPRGNLMTKAYNPFLGSRVFTTINAKLVELGKEPIDWTLP